MPYSLRSNHPDCSGWAVINTRTGKVVGCHPTKKKAVAHLRALYANVGDAGAQDLALNVQYTDAPGGMMGFGAARGDGADGMRAEALRRFTEDTTAAARTWHEKDHPRKPPGSREGGEFTEKTGGGGRRAPATPATRKPASPASPAPARTPKAPAKPPAGGTASPVSDPKQFLARYDGWRNGLTPAQDKALRFWQSPGFALMNGQLRAADTAKLKAAEHATDADLARAKKASGDWKKAINAAPPLNEPIVTYRAFSAAQFGDLKPGDKITDKGFVAMSLLNDATAVGRAGNQATAEITLPAGTRLGAGSSREVDLAPPASFAVTGVQRRGGKVHYQLTYLPKGG